MVQILPAVQKGPSFAQKLFGGLAEGTAEAIPQYLQHRKEQAAKQMQMQALQKQGIDPSFMNLPPEMQKAYASEKFKSQFAPETYKAKYGAQLQAMKDLGFDFGGPQEPGTPETRTAPSFEAAPGEEKPKGKKPAKKPMYPEKQIQAMALINPASADKMQQYNNNILAQQKHEELLKEKQLTRAQVKELAEKKSKETRENEARRETLTYRTELANKATAAQAGISNKMNLLNLIKTGNLDDPTYAALAKALPLNLGQRLLSPETVQYKGGLVDEYKDLRTIFSGATRVKEIDILEAKIADIYLTDAQKEAILNSRINTLRADILKAEAAAEVEKEYPYIGILEFQRKVDEKAKPKIDALFNNILEEHKAIMDQAERRKQLPLDYRNPDDLQIIDQILKESGGDPKKAEKLAKKRGYTW